METLLRRWLAFAMLLAMAVGETIDPTNSTASSSKPDTSNPIKLSVSERGNAMPISEVMGLTPASKVAIPVRKDNIATE